MIAVGTSSNCSELTRTGTIERMAEEERKMFSREMTKERGVRKRENTCMFCELQGRLNVSIGHLVEESWKKKIDKKN